MFDYKKEPKSETINKKKGVVISFFVPAISLDTRGFYQ